MARVRHGCRCAILDQTYRTGIKVQRSLWMVRYTDSDWPGCADTRRSMGYTIINAEETQTGTPATSSGEAETKAFSREATDILFIQDLAGEDFNLKLSMPRLWTNASTTMQNAKLFGAGSSMRHIELAALFVQKLVHVDTATLQIV